MHRFRLLIFLFVLGFFRAEAQDINPLSSVFVEGFITNAEGKYIENVHVVNISSNKGMLSTREGQFRMATLPGDTLRFTGVGYIPFTYYVQAERQSPVVPLHVVLQSDTILIQGVEIYPWPADAAALKAAVLAMEDQTPKIPDLKLNDLRYKAAGLPVGSPPSTLPGMANPGLTYTIKGPITALYEAFSKTAKSQRKYESLVNADHRKEVAAQRYNAEVVKQVTHFTSDKEIQDFMMFCNLSVDFILKSSEYDLYKAIYDCQLAYIEMKKEDSPR